MAEPNTDTYHLKTPIEFGDQTIATLRLREPTAEEIEKAWSKNEATMALKLISQVSAVPVAALRKMTQTDLQGAGETLANFTQ